MTVTDPVPARRDVVLASGNAGKLRELGELLAGTALVVRAQGDFGVPPVDETGLSFIENALIKARHAARICGCAAIADDSGIVVDALSGAPGIRSARYAGADASDADNVLKLLRELEGVPAEQRTARFVCAVVYLAAADDPLPIVCEGLWSGTVLEEPRGAGGFGYDPVFLVDGSGRTAAELDPAEKNRSSHRAQALAQLRARLLEG